MGAASRMSHQLDNFVLGGLADGQPDPVAGLRTIPLRATGQSCALGRWIFQQLIERPKLSHFRAICRAGRVVRVHFFPHRNTLSIGFAGYIPFSKNHLLL
jgi:hypothetical protein